MSNRWHTNKASMLRRWRSRVVRIFLYDFTPPSQIHFYNEMKKNLLATQFLFVSFFPFVLSSSICKGKWEFWMETFYNRCISICGVHGSFDGCSCWLHVFITFVNIIDSHTLLFVISWMALYKSNAFQPIHHK